MLTGLTDSPGVTITAHMQLLGSEKQRRADKWKLDDGAIISIEVIREMKSNGDNLEEG